MNENKWIQKGKVIIDIWVQWFELGSPYINARVFLNPYPWIISFQKPPKCYLFLLSPLKLQQRQNNKHYKAVNKEKAK